MHGRAARRLNEEDFGAEVAQQVAAEGAPFIRQVENAILRKHGDLSPEVPAG